MAKASSFCAETSPCCTRTKSSMQLQPAALNPQTFNLEMVVNQLGTTFFAWTQAVRLLRFTADYSVFGVIHIKHSDSTTNSPVLLRRHPTRPRAHLHGLKTRHPKARHPKTRHPKARHAAMQASWMAAHSAPDLSQSVHTMRSHKKVP